MKKFYLSFALLSTCLCANAESVKIDAAHFPDTSFRSEVLWLDKTYGNDNGYLDDAESSPIVLAGHTTTATSIRINSATAASDGTTDSDIHDFTGIKYFTNLKKFGTGIGGQVEFNPSVEYTIDLSGMTNLEAVYIQNPMNSNRLHLNLKNCTALKTLSIYQEQNPIDFDITGCKNLESITKQQCQHANSSSSFSISAPAAEFPNLTKITLNNNYYLQDVNINVGALKELTINSCNTLTGENLVIGANVNLETLSITNNAKLTYITFDLNNFSKLTKLSLAGNNLGGKSFNISKLNVLTADGNSYFGNQASSGVVSVLMTTNQYANFQADNTNNKNVKVTTLTPIDVTAPTVADKSLTLSSTYKSVTVKWNAATDNTTSADKLKYYVFVTTDESKLADAWNNILSAHDQDGALTFSTTDCSYDATFSSESTSSLAGINSCEKYYVNVLVMDEAGNKTYYTAGSVTTTTGVSVKDTEITEDNISSLPTGVSFDMNTKTLTLNNATIRTMNGSSAIIVHSPVTINLVGTNKITSVNESGMVLAAATKITGGGTLDVLTGSEIKQQKYKAQVHSIMLLNADLEVTGCTLTIDASNTAEESAAIANRTSVDTESTLSVGANTTIQTKGAIIGICSFAMDKSEGFLTPENAQFSSNMKCIVNAIGEYAKVIEIAPKEIIQGINDVEENTNGKPAATYNLAGQSVSADYKGIVIRDGRKILVK